MKSNLLFSVVTPSLNQGEYIRDAINSVLNQDAELEHIIVDGVSTDNTLTVVKEYDHLKYISEPDNGPANAINKGLRLSQGDIFCWLNADDYYEPNVFSTVAEIFARHPDVSIVYGNLTFVDSAGNILYKDKTTEYNLYNLIHYYADNIRQPATFFRKSLVNVLGGVNEELKCVFDYDLIIRMLKVSRAYYIDMNLAYYRDYPDTITRKNIRRQGLEIIKISMKHGGKFYDKLVLKCLLKKVFFPHR